MNDQDLQHLDLLSLFHYILGGLSALFSCLFLLHIFTGMAMVSGTFFHDAKGGEPPAFFGWMLIVMGAVFMVIGWSLAICMLLAGRKLKQRKSRTFCTVVAGIECLNMPLGTILGVFTLVVLSKESVKALFDPQSSPSLTNTPPPITEG